MNNQQVTGRDRTRNKKPIVVSTLVYNFPRTRSIACPVNDRRIIGIFIDLIGSEMIKGRTVDEGEYEKAVGVGKTAMEVIGQNSQYPRHNIGDKYGYQSH